MLDISALIDVVRLFGNDDVDPTQDDDTFPRCSYRTGDRGQRITPRGYGFLTPSAVRAANPPWRGSLPAARCRLDGRAAGRRPRCPAHPRALLSSLECAVRARRSRGIACSLALAPSAYKSRAYPARAMAALRQRSACRLACVDFGGLSLAHWLDLVLVHVLAAAQPRCHAGHCASHGREGEREA